MEFTAFLLSASVAGVLWLRLLLDRSESIYSPLFWYLVFHSVVFIVRPFILSMNGWGVIWSYMGLSYTPDITAFTCLVSTLGLLFFFFGYSLARTYSKITVINRRVNLPSWEAIRFVFLTLGVVAAYSAVFTTTSAASDNVNIETDRINGVSININTNGYLMDAQFLFLGLCTLLAAKARFAYWSLIPTLLFVSYRGYIGWGRWSIVLTLLAMFLLLLKMRGRNWPPLALLPVAFAMYCVFSVLGADRDIIKSAISGQGSVSISIVDSLLDSLGGMDLANFEYLSYVLYHVPDSSGTYTYGLQHLQVFTEPIPRVFWSGKPVGPPFAQFNLNDFGNFLGMTVSVVGDGWMSGGYIGLGATMVVLGYVLGRAYTRFLSSSLDAKYLLGYLVVCALFGQFFRDGSLVSVAKACAFGLLPLIVAYWFDRYVSVRSGVTS